jgi:hypothetical protein
LLNIILFQEKLRLKITFTQLLIGNFKKLKFMRTPFTFILLICFGFNISAQEVPKGYFRSPLDIPIILSGNFGELRSNHFHSGLDMKTEGVEGKRVYAVADGYVSRIKVSPWGYGKALYITHPNGLVSVYAHLKDYNGQIASYVKKAQYASKQFEIELLPLPTEMLVKKGDVVAFTGNTGGSGGPHLHFEIRDEKTEHPLNPFLYGFDVADNVKPIVNEIIIYPLDEHSNINGSFIAKRFTLVPNGNTLKPSQAISAHGKIGFGISSHDQHNGAHNRVGVYSIELKVDGKRKYFHQMDRFSFDHSRCLNSHIDYPIYKKSKNWFQKLHVAPNNQLTIYSDLVDKGVLTFEKDGIHEIEYIIKDFKGNSTTVAFPLEAKGFSVKNMQGKISAKPEAYFYFAKENVYKNDEISVTIPENALYDNLNFEYRKSATIKNAISPTYHIQNEYVPIHLNYNLSIKLDSLPIEIRRKALVVHYAENGASTPIGGDLREGWLNCTPKVFGNFAVMLDTIAPKITPTKIPKQGTPFVDIRFKITDELSGIKSYHGSIDGDWVLMEYDPKQSLLFHVFEKELTAGNHTFRLEVKDQRGNMSEYSVEFVK